MASEHNENKDAFQKDANCLLAATICASIATKCHHQLGVLKWTSWTGLQWWPPGVTSRGSLYSEVTCPGGSLYSEVPCLDGGWAGGFPAQWGPMSGGGRAVCVGGGGSLCTEVIVGGGQMGLPSPLNRMTDRRLSYENITFPQLRWPAVINFNVTET